MYLLLLLLLRCERGNGIGCDTTRLASSVFLLLLLADVLLLRSVACHKRREVAERLCFETHRLQRHLEGLRRLSVAAAAVELNGGTACERHRRFLFSCCCSCRFFVVFSVAVISSSSLLGRREIPILKQVFIFIAVPMHALAALVAAVGNGDGVLDGDRRRVANANYQSRVRR